MIMKGDIDVSSIKRLYVDLQIEKNCPKCGEQCEHDLNEQYLSYVGEVEKESICFYCDNCDNEFTLQAKIQQTQLTLDVDMETIHDA